MMTPFERYQRALATEKFFPDEQQYSVIEHFQKLYNQLTLYTPQNLSQKLSLKNLWSKQNTIKGLYIWGSVGVGKTWLMDMFFESLSLKQKWRIHFHDFMHEVHDQLQRYQGKKNPLDFIAKTYAKKIKLLCFDEFFVSDIGDAMILGNLFTALFKQGIIIVATSNVPPDLLYTNGLQRERFLPAISGIKKNMEVLHLSTQQDYRLRELTQSGLFFYPLTQENNKKIKKLFDEIATGDKHYGKDIYLYDRPLTTIAFADNIIWFDFQKLCNIPRSQMDYLSIGKRWETIIVDNIPIISAQETNRAQYFINLIDILYDMKRIVILHSASTPETIYTNGELSFEFKRTCSRLIEMQSAEYLTSGKEKTWKK